MAEAFSDWATRVLGERFLRTELIPPLSPRSGIQGKPVRLCHGSKNFKLNRPTEQRTEQSSAAWLRVFRSEGASRAAHRSTRFEPARFRGQTGSRPAPYQTKIPRPSPISLRYRF